MGTRTGTCEERSILREMGRNHSVALPAPHAGFVAGAQQPTAGSALTLNNTVLPVPVSLVFFSYKDPATSPVQTFRIDGKNQFNEDRVEFVTMVADPSATPQARFNGARTEFAYWKINSITYVSGPDYTLAGYEERVAVGITYHSPHGRCLLGLPFAIKNANALLAISNGNFYDAAPVVKTYSYWTVELPYVGFSARNLMLTFRDESLYLY